MMAAMDQRPDDNAIEASLRVPEDMAQEIFADIEAQDAVRGDWPSPRDADQPEAPWPSPDSAALRYLIWKATASLEAGMDPRTAIVTLAAHAWFEGGIVNYDRGQRDGRRPRSV